MPFGPGVYDDELTEVREKVKAHGAVLVIFDGVKGSGFSAHLSLGLTLALPTILRSIAKQIEDSGETR